MDASLAFPAPVAQPGLWAAVLVVLGGATLAWCRNTFDQQQSSRQPSALAQLKHSRRTRSANRLGRAAGWVAEIERHSEMTMNAEMLIESSHPILEDVSAGDLAAFLGSIARQRGVALAALLKLLHTTCPALPAQVQHGKQQLHDWLPFLSPSLP